MDRPGAHGKDKQEFLKSTAKFVFTGQEADVIGSVVSREQAREGCSLITVWPVGIPGRALDSCGPRACLWLPPSSSHPRSRGARCPVQ